MKVTDEKKLLEGIINRDENTFRLFVDSYQTFVVRICLRFTNNLDDAKDIAQEVFIEVYHSANKFRHDSKISTWLYRIAVNKSLNFLRAGKKNTLLCYLDDIFNTEGEMEQEFDIAENNKDKLEENDERKILDDAVSSLPDNQKTAFVLHKIEGLPYKEICEVMGLSLPSVESLIHRAKTGLQKKLYRYYKKNYK